MYEPLEERKIWALFAEEYNAEHLSKGFGNQFDFYDKVIYRHKGLKITMEFKKGEDGGTFIYAPFAAREDFNFSICPSGFFEELIKFFGSQDVEVGDPIFDGKVIVKSGKEKSVKQFLSGTKIRESLLTLFSKGIRAGCFHAGGKPYDMMTGRAEYIYFRYPGLLNETEHIKQIFQLIIESLDRLIEMGITIPSDAP